MAQKTKTIRETKSEPIEISLKNTLSRNTALRLLLSGQYRWTVWAAIFAGMYWILGVIIASMHGLQALLDFLLFQKLYVALFAIIMSVTAASWYAQALLEVLVGIHESFKVETQTLLELVRHWLHYISLPTLFMMSAVYVIVGTVILYIQSDLSQSLIPAIITFWNSWTDWMTAYLQIALAICGLILGCAIQAFLATLLLFQKLFGFEFRLFQYRNLSSLSTFSSGLTVASFVAVALLILFMYPDIKLFGSLIGILGGLLMFVASQFAYQNAVARAKRQYFHHLGIAYEQSYKVIEQNPLDTKALQISKGEIEALRVFEETIRAIPVWLVDVSDITRILLSLLAPVLSLLLNYFFSLLP